MNTTIRKLKIGVIVLAAAMPIAGARAINDSKYPDWQGQWSRLEVPGIAPSFDPAKRPGLGQQAPLTPEYQKILEASLADQAAGGGGSDRIICASHPACR